METLTIEGKIRKTISKSDTKRIRREGGVPCVLYGKDEPKHFSAALADFNPLIYSAELNKVNLKLDDGTETEAIIKDVQYHVISDNLIHADFLELVEKKPVVAELPVNFIGTPVGVKLNGGKLMRKLRKVKIKALPKDLAAQIDADVSNLNNDDSLFVRDLKLENIQVLNSPSVPIAIVLSPKRMKAAAAAVLETTTAAPAATEEGAPEAAEEGGKPEGEPKGEAS